jgi:hypothetical protein
MGLRYLTLGAISAVLLSLAHGTWTSLSAQERFPAHPVHLIVPASAGGSLDIGIRIIEPRLSVHLRDGAGRSRLGRLVWACLGQCAPCLPHKRQRAIPGPWADLARGGLLSARAM